MAIQQRTHGDSLPVFAIDTLAGPYGANLGTAVQIAGPKLEFFGMDLGGELYTSANNNQLGTNGAVEKVIQLITQLATTHFYQVDASGVMSIAVYPVGAWTAAALQSEIQALGTVASYGTNSSYSLAGATVTNVGFKLSPT
jgi:hypothetical protein